MMTRRPAHRTALLGIACLLLLSACATAPAIDPALRPANWATPITMAGLPNLHRIDASLYRSQQPTETGLRNAREQLGIRTVINLRTFHSEAKAAARAGLLTETLSVKTWHIEDEDVVRVLQILRQRQNGPFLLHCRHGADRTGVMAAMYRIVEQGWTKEQALDEMVHGGYGFHPFWSNIIAYLEKVDVEHIRAQVAATASAGAAACKNAPITAHDTAPPQPPHRNCTHE